MICEVTNKLKQNSYIAMLSYHEQNAFTILSVDKRTYEPHERATNNQKLMQTPTYRVKKHICRIVLYSVSGSMIPAMVKSAGGGACKSSISAASARPII